MTNNVTGIVLDIPKEVLTNIKRANDAILTLEDTSRRAAQKIEGNFGVQMPRGVQKFIDILKKAQDELDNLSNKGVKINVTSSMPASLDISGLVQEMSRLSQTISEWDVKIKKASSSTKSAEVNVAELVEKLQKLDPKKLNIAELTEYINELQTALRKQGVSDTNLEKSLVEAKKQLREIRAEQERPMTSTLAEKTREHNALLREELELQKKIAAETKNQEVTKAKGGTPTAESSNYIARLQERLTNVQSRITELGKELGQYGEKAAKAFDEKRVQAEAKAYNDLAKAIERARNALSKKDETDLSKSRSEYKRVLEQIRQTERAQERLNAAINNPSTSGELKRKSTDALAAAEQQLDTLNSRKVELENKYGAQLDDIRRQQEIRHAQIAVQEFEKGEKEKQRIARQAADDRYNEDMRQMRLQNQQLTADAKSQRMSVVSNKEQRENALYQQRIQEIQRLQAEIERLDKTDVNYSRDLDRLNQRINELLTATRQRTEYSAQEALSMARSAKTLRDYEVAARALKNALSGIDKKKDAEEWNRLNAEYQKAKKHIEDLKKAMGDFKTQASKNGDIAGRLARTLAATFSVSAITNYIEKMVQVRAQFELQQTALRAILQDKQKADQIFQQVQQMALQSPFSIMQMTTFTKQLAAYRIEADKLVGTTKMLADVSAGLSVDMSRLILAYGQVKAANYLRATEVRQFTEAGLNIAGELATYFSELQGKMVSVGDVMEMITKRMVRFEDVEEVFKRVTSAGGLFYDMQKKQSETLWGQLQRIKDAMGIMFNEIGKSNQGTLSWFLTTIRALISNWRILATAIKVAGGFLGSFYIISKSLAISKFTSGLIAGMRAYIASIRGAIAAAGGLKAALSSLNFTGWGAIIAGIGLAVSAIIELTSNTSALKEELDRIAGESMTDMYDAMYKFSELAKTATDATKSYKERAEAMESLNRAYKDILPSEMLEIDNIRQMSEGYTEATEAIRQYYMEVAKKRAQETVANEQEKAWNTLINHIKDDAAYLKDSQESLADMPIATLKGLLGKTMMELKAELESGRTEVGHAWERFKELFKETSGREIVDSFYSRGFRAYFGEYTFTITDFYDDIIDITKQGTAAQMEIEAQYAEGFSIETKDIIRQYNERKKVVSDFQRAMTTVNDLKQKGGLRDESGNLTEMGAKARTELYEAMGTLNQYLSELGEAPIYWRNINDATDNSTDALLYFDEIQKKVLGGFLKNVQEAGGDKSLQGWAERTERELMAAGLSDLQLDIIKLSKESATANGMQMQMLNKLRISAETNYASAAADAKALSDQATDNVKKIQATKTALLEMARAAGKSMSDAQAQAEAEARHGNGFTEEELKAQAEFWEKLAKLYGNYERERDNGRQKDIWTLRLNLMQKVNKEYEKLLKYYSKEEAMTKIRQSYGDAAAEAFQGTQWADISKWGTFDAQATIDQLKKLAEVAGKEAKKKILEAAGTLEAEIEIKVKEQEIQKAKDEVQKAFDNYELTKTLGNLGLNVDLTFMVGGRPTTLAQLRKDVEDKLQVAKATKGQEELVKVYEDYLRKITDMENKAAVERLKNYSKYLTKMYSDRAKAMIESYTTMKNMEQDFADYREKLEKEAADPATSEQRRKEISQQISMLETQAREAIKGVRNDLDGSLNKLDWEAFKGSPVFTQMYSDLETLSKKGIDLLITKLTTMRDKLQAMDNVDYRAVREMTKYIEKLNTQRIEVGSWKELNAAIREANIEKKKGNDIDKAQSELMSEQANLDAANAEIATLQMIINLKQQEGEETNKTKNLSSEQLNLYKLSDDELRKMLSKQQKNASTAQDNMLHWRGVVATLQKGKKALEEQLKRIKMLHDDFGKVYDSAIDLADALGADTEIWGDFSKGVGDSIFQVIELSLQLKLMGLAANSSLGVIGYIAIALQVVASLLASIFKAGDKRKEKQIQRLKSKVEDLETAYEDLGEAIDNAYKFSDYKLGYQQSLDNLNQRAAAYREMIKLEESKKKTDKDKLKEYQDALRDTEKTRKELKESMYEDWGSVGESGIRSEAENFVSAWLDAYKETGDGLDGLKDHWDEFFENLVMKQAASAVVSERMKKYVGQINAAIENGGGGLSLAQTFAQIGQELKSELGDWNEDLKAFFDAVGIKGGQGDLLLSDLQKGIQNITEPQAAAIEAYLNSMRFAVFEQNNILTEMLAAIQAQYAPDNGSPMLQEVRAIRSLVASIDDRLSRVIVSRNSGNSNYIVKVN